MVAHKETAVVRRVGIFYLSHYFVVKMFYDMVTQEIAARNYPVPDIRFL